MSNANFICIPNRIFDKGAFYEQTEAKVHALTQLFPNDEIDLFLGLRNPATFLPDVFAASKADTLDAYLRGFPPTEIRWSNVIKRILHVAPNAQLTVWCNEDTPMIWAELIRDIAGVSSDTRIAGGFDLLSTIMSDDGMKRFLTYMNENPPQTEQQKRKIIMAFLDKFALEDEIEEEVDLPGMTPELIGHLSEIYEQDVDMIASMEAVHFIEP